MTAQAAKRRILTMMYFLEEERSGQTQVVVERE